MRNYLAFLALPFLLGASTATPPSPDCVAIQQFVEVAEKTGPIEVWNGNDAGARSAVAFALIMENTKPGESIEHFASKEFLDRVGGVIVAIGATQVDLGWIEGGRWICKVGRLRDRSQFMDLETVSIGRPA